MDRREFLRLLAIAGVASGTAACAGRSARPDLYEAPAFGQARLIHFTDCHAQLLPVYFRELRDSVILYVNPCEGMPVERIVEITGGQRVVIVAGLEEPPGAL